MAATAAVHFLNTMAQNTNTTTNATDNNNNDDDDIDVKPTILHDFLGRPQLAPAAKLTMTRPVATASDLGSERHVGTLYEGVPFFSQKTDVAGSKIQFSGSKRSHSDSGFMPPSREGIPRPDYPEASHLMKMLRNVGAERPRLPHEDEAFMGVHQMRPTSSSQMVQQANVSKWERATPVNVGPVLQYPPRAGQGVVPYGYNQPVSNRFLDSFAGSPLMSQSAADEGSRTGIKGSGILSSVAEPSSSKLKSLISNNEPNSSTPLPRQGSTPVSQQMTIFYGGQAHVFDDVHPNKADVIMALAGSNGGSWSTSFLPNSSRKPSDGEEIPLRGGQGNILMKDTRGQPQAGAEQKSDQERH